MSEETQLSCTSKQTRRSKILAAAEACVGKPFRHQGRNPEIGIDCLGLAIYCAKQAGYGDVPDDRTYNARVTSHDLRAGLTKYCRKKLPKDLLPGDIVLLQLKDEPTPRHIGIYTGTHIIHATLRRRAVVKDPVATLQQGICGVYEYPEVDLSV